MIGAALRSPLECFRAMGVFGNASTYSVLRSIAAPQRFSSRCARLDVPGIGSMKGERCSSQAIAIYGTVASCFSQTGPRTSPKRAALPRWFGTLVGYCTRGERHTGILSGRQ
jgi:hypothetical protein